MTLADVAENKKNLVKEYSRHSNDTGSSEVQIALLTDRIKNLTTHFASNHKDEHSKRGMMALIAKRKKLLSYLKNNDLGRYKDIIQKLGLRK